MQKALLILIVISLQIQVFANNSLLILEPSFPELGKTVSFTYTGKLAKKGTKVLYICHFLGSNFIPETNITYKLNNNKLTACFTVPDSASYISIKITNKKEYDNNNGCGYGFNIFKKGKPLKGTYFAEGQAIMLSNLLLDANVDGKKAANLMEKDYAKYPDLKDKTRSLYLDAIINIPSRKYEAINLAKKYYDEILKTGKNENCTLDYVNIIANGDFNSRDSLLMLVTKKYPQGMTAFNLKKMYLEVYSTDKPDTALIIYNNILKDFPNIDINNKSEIIGLLLLIYSVKMDCNNFEKTMSAYLSSIKCPSLYIITQSYNFMAWNLYAANKELIRAKLYAEKSINANIQKDSLSIQYGEALNTYAAILSKIGDTIGAINNQRKAVELTSTTNERINEQLMELLISEKLYEEAKMRGEEFITENSSTPKIEELYKTACKAVSGNIDTDQILTILKSKAEWDYIEKLRLELTNFQAPDFNLKDLNGKDVKLSDYRGSIVVLDFWATWCVPCINSFSSMQKAMNEMKDKNVVFLYVNTQEDYNSNNRSERIRKILEEKKTSEFQIVLDEKISNKYMVQEAYKVLGFPSKFIIDRTGKVRYSSVGFDGDDALIKVIKTVIKIIDE